MFELIRDHQLNIMLGLSCVSGFVALCVCVTTWLSKSRKLALVMIELSAMLLLLFDRYAYIYRGDESSTGYYMVRISNFIVFFMTLFILFAFNRYLRDVFSNEGGMEKTSRLIAITDILVCIGIILVIISQFTGLYYTFDDKNCYQRSSLYFISYIIPSLVLIIELIAIFKYCKKVTKGVRFSLFLFAAGPLVASVFQFFSYGLSLINIAIVILAISLFVFALMDMNETVQRAAKMEIEYFKEQQKSMQRLFEQTATALVNSIDAKDKYTHGHSSRVAEYSRRIAEMYGKNEKECYEIYYAALLHDVGKIGIKDTIINKDGRLDDDEYEQIKRHPAIGQGILSGISEFQYLSIGANYHHERYDGKGYPDKLKGEDIPEIARIVAVADAYDAMSSKRSYRDPIPQQKIREEFVKGSGTQFDPKFAKIMIHLIDLDSEYEMQEKEVVKELSGRNELECKEYRSDISEGIVLLPNLTSIHLKSISISDTAPENNIPSIILFDSLDGRVYTDEKMKKDMVYCEYGEIRFDGRAIQGAARKMLVRKKDNRVGEKLLAGISRDDKEKVYLVEGVKVSDHVLIRIVSPEQTLEITVALPDSTRYCYIGLTGENCNIRDVLIDKEEKPVSEDYITRIAEKISFINGPEGDLPSVQVDGFRSASTVGTLINDGMSISFHAMSLPTARLVWHTPFIVIYYSDDGLVNGVNYREFSLVRLDGENWETGGFAENKIIVNRNDSFSGWDDWKEFNRKGFDATVRFEKNGNVVTTHTENDGILIKNITKVNGRADKIYMAITGDQVAITNIRLKNVRNDIPETEPVYSDRVRSSIVNVTSSGRNEDDALAMTERLSADSGLAKNDRLHLRLLAEELISLLQSAKGDLAAEYYLEVSGQDYELHLNADVELTPEMKNIFISSRSKDGNETKGLMGRIRQIVGSALISKKESTISWSLNDYRREIEQELKSKDNESLGTGDELEKSIIANLADDVKVKIDGNNVEITVYKKFGQTGEV